jgi:hypothetical protein
MSKKEIINNTLPTTTCHTDQKHVANWRLSMQILTVKNTASQRGNYAEIFVDSFPTCFSKKKNNRKTRGKALTSGNDHLVLFSVYSKYMEVPINIR